MTAYGGLAGTAAARTAGASALDELPLRVLSEDDTVILESCRVEIPARKITVDHGLPGVLHVRASDVRVVFSEGSVLLGMPQSAAPSLGRGTGIVVHPGATNVTIEGATVRGYKVGIHAREADGLTLIGCDVSDNFAQRLASTPQAADDGADWLTPHHNDEGQWAAQYGAGILVERSRDVSVRGCRARVTQNGLILDRVTHSRVYDNDFSFLSGWGLAMWRSSDNVISRNALDFCVRGYSHGVYNRGQDSAGLLMFEQNCRNVIAENSITHGGDGVFAFAGREALGETGIAAAELHERDLRGNADNLFVGNDLSYAAAHGLELTFSGGNVVRDNRFAGNAICGIWAGYTRDMLVERNRFEANGEAGYGGERGGVNAEHAQRLLVRDNTFRGDRCGVHLWWDADPQLAALPWSEAWGFGCVDNAVVDNRFEGLPLAVELRDTDRTLVRLNAFRDVAEDVRVSGSAPRNEGEQLRPAVHPPELVVLGETRPVGARAHLAGRANIVMGPWGPWDHERPLLMQLERTATRHVWEWRGLPEGVVPELHLGSSSPAGPRAPLPSTRDTHTATDDLLLEREAERLVVTLAPGRTGSFGYHLDLPGVDEGLWRDALVRLPWRVSVFPWSVDPREDERAFAEAARGPESFTVELDELRLPFHGGGPADVPALAAAHAALGPAAPPLPGSDRFGTMARFDTRLLAGQWTVRTTSDDGLRVWLDDELLIDDWTWHAPRQHSASIWLHESREVGVRVEHFELDGWALLEVAFERSPP